jgi:hypothetical protein
MTCMRARPKSPFTFSMQSPDSLLLYPIVLELEGGRSNSESERMESLDATDIAKTKVWIPGTVSVAEQPIRQEQDKTIV